MSLLNADALPRRVDTTIATALADQRLVGTVVLIARDGEVVHRAVAGHADREAGRPMREDSIFRFSSLTKPIVSAAAMALIEAGSLRLDDELARWIPEFRPRQPDSKEAAITVRQLLTHTAGLTYGLFQPADGPYARHGVSDGLAEPGLSMADELARLEAVPLAYVPGSAWGYSLAIDVLGEVLARAAGMSLPDVVAQKVTGPLGMRDTSFEVRDRARLAVAYANARPPRLMRDPDVVPFGDGAGIKFSPARVFDPASFASGGAGLAGTAGDFLTFLETIRRGGAPILSRASTEAMTANQIGSLRITTEETPSWGFGFGGAVLMDRELAGVPQENGTWKWGGVYGHHWYVDKTNRLTVIALTNTAIEGMAGSFVAELQRAVYGH